MKNLILTTLSLLIVIQANATKHTCRLRTSKTMSKWHYEYKPGDKIVTDLSWDTELVFGKLNGVTFTELNNNKTQQIVEQIQFFLNFNGDTKELTAIKFNCSSPSTGKIAFPVGEIKNAKDDNGDIIIKDFAGADVDDFQVIIKVIYNTNKCPDGLSPDPSGSSDEIFTVDLEYFGANIVSIDIADNESNGSSILNQFANGLTYSSVAVATNFKSGISGMATTPVISFKTANWFTNHLDIEYLMTTISSDAEEGEDSVITGMGGCVGLFGRKSKGLKLGYHYNTELDKGYFVLALSPAIIPGITEFFKDWFNHPQRIK